MNMYPMCDPPRTGTRTFLTPGNPEANALTSAAADDFETPDTYAVRSASPARSPPFDVVAALDDV